MLVVFTELNVFLVRLDRSLRGTAGWAELNSEKNESELTKSSGKECAGTGETMMHPIAARNARKRWSEAMRVPGGIAAIAEQQRLGTIAARTLFADRIFFVLAVFFFFPRVMLGRLVV